MTGRDAGAHFYRTDLQVHTPRDANWTGPRPKTEAERQAYAVKFVAECRVKGIDAVAITDHHDMAFVPYIQAAAAAELGPVGLALAEHERLVVFPGIELTIAVPCQALLVLDADFPADRFDDVLKALNIEATDPSDAKLPDVTVLSPKSLQELQDLLDERTWLRGRYIVLPNVTDAGHQTLIRKGMHPAYIGMPCLGGYLDGGVERQGTGATSITAGADAAWGSKRIAVFQTSDARSADFAKLGAPSSWIKWAAPTAEALRQACLAQDSRLSHEPPALPLAFVSHLSVSNSKFLGPIELELNPQYNAIVGGRGTGKSTLLDYLRWALCDQPPSDTGGEEISDPRTRQRRLIETTLAPMAAIVDVHLVINDIPHVVRRAAASGEIQLKVGDEDFRKVREQDIRELLAVHAYSQKQLSSVAIRLTEVLRFVTAPIAQALSDQDRVVADLGAKIRESYAGVLRARQLAASVGRLSLERASLESQAATLRTGLVAVSEADRALLDAKPRHDAVRSLLNRERSSLADIAGRLELIVAEVQQLAGADQTVASDDDVLGLAVAAFEAARQQALGTLMSALGSAESMLAEAMSEASAMSQAQGAAQSELALFDEAYEQAKQRSAAHRVQLDELQRIEERLASVANELEAQMRSLAAQGDTEGEQAELEDQLFAAYGARSELLDAQCVALEGLSEGLLRATLIRGRGMQALNERLKGATVGSNLRGARVDAFFDELGTQSDPIKTWQTALRELEALTTLEPDADVSTEQAPVLAQLGFPAADLKRIASKITPEAWLDLALTPLTDAPIFEYRTREGEYIDFELASAGQQATALLKVLLAQPGAPLIIDQPEDDLDSQVIQDIVRMLWAAKARRQLIFTSHNANLVVNGDADLVICCDYRKAGDQSGGRIKLQGSIDLPDVKTEITHVMEGGEKAFKLRRDKYGF